MLYMGIGVAIVIGILWIANYNTIIKYKNWIEESWAQIDVQLKRRFDLLPNLLETVKGFAKHEQETLEKVIAARNSITDGGTREEQMVANNEISTGLKSIFALSESYPDLKSNQNFLLLQEELTGTENKIAYARQLYNTTVMKYNTKIQSIPSNMVASVHGFTTIKMLETLQEERQNVKISFQ